MLGSSVPAAIPVYDQTAATFESLNIDANTTLADNTTDISTNALSATTKLQRRINIQKCTHNFTTGDTGVPTPGNFDTSYNACNKGGRINLETEVYYIKNIVLHIEALQFKTRDYSDNE